MTLSNEQLAALRKSYERAELDEARSEADPLRQFERWMNEAVEAQVPEPNAMTLATVGPDSRPSTRIVLIKGFDARGIVWFTNYQSRKGRELAANPLGAFMLIGMGVDALSVGPSALAEIKKVIRSVSQEEGRAAVDAALRAGTPDEVVRVLSAPLTETMDLSLFSGSWSLSAPQ